MLHIQHKMGLGAATFYFSGMQGALVPAAGRPPRGTLILTAENEIIVGGGGVTVNWGGGGSEGKGLG